MLRKIAQKAEHRAGLLAQIGQSAFAKFIKVLGGFIEGVQRLKGAALLF